MYCLDDIYLNIQIQQCIFSVITVIFLRANNRDLISHLIENHTMDEIKCVQGRKQGLEQGRTIEIDDKNL
jgi:hypothetical protein